MDTTEDDEYNAYFDEHEFTEEDFKGIDDIIARYTSPPPTSAPPPPFPGSKSSGSPKIVIEIPPSPKDEKMTSKKPMKSLLSSMAAGASYRRQQTTVSFEQSLLERFRPRGRLSVTDLVGPAWCEVKFDYSLRGACFPNPFCFFPLFRLRFDDRGALWVGAHTRFQPGGYENVQRFVFVFVFVVSGSDGGAYEIDASYWGGLV